MVEVGLCGKDKVRARFRRFLLRRQGSSFLGGSVDFFGKVEVGEVSEEFVGFSVVGFGGFDFVFEGAEVDRLAVIADLRNPFAGLFVEIDTFEAGG